MPEFIIAIRNLLKAPNNIILDGDPCGLHLAEGSGRFFISRYYFDKETRRCHEFAYRGQKGNANNFLTKEDCEIFCPG